MTEHWPIYRWHLRLQIIELHGRLLRIQSDKKDPLEAPKIAFMTNNKNYHYEAMPFGLKNTGETFQRSMDTIFAAQIGKNLEI